MGVTDNVVFERSKPDYIQKFQNVSKITHWERRLQI